MTPVPTLRVARASDNFEDLLRFYQAGLGLEVLCRFENHDGFDGIMLGMAGAAYHLEFTRCRECESKRAPTKDNLLVFYVPDQRQWQAAVSRMRQAGFEPVPSFNPYWNRAGLTFEDPDGYRIVLQAEAAPF